MEFIQWKVIRVIQEIADTKTFVLEPVDGRPVHWQAGQFLTFLFNHERRRSYSISTTPGVDTHIAITVKRKVNGEISRHVLNHWKVGTVASSLPPAGLFTITNSSRYIFIAAGSGIVPIFGLIKQVRGSNITLIYQNRDEYNIIFDKQLHGLLIHRIDLLSNPLSHALKPARLNNWLLENILSRMDTSNALFYTCGPEPFMRMVQFTLRVMGFHEDQLRKEHFEINPPRKPAFTMKPVPHQVIFNDHQFTTTFPDTILQSAKKHGISIPFSCNSGRCGTCVLRCQQGTVKMSNNEVLTEKDLQQGLVLTCVGYAETDVVLIS